MTFPKMALIAVLTAVCCFTGCVEDKDYGEEANSLRPQTNQNETANINISENANVADDNAIKLHELVNVPFEVEQDSLWKEMPIENPDGSATGHKKLIAVFRFSREDGEKLKNDLGKSKQPFEASVDAESWFPAELIAKSSTTGDDTLKGTGYNADSFIKPPYKSGSLIHIRETGYFVLILQTN